MSARTVEGIVLQKTDYSESSLILKVLTKEEGIQSFIFQGAKRKNKNGNLISPLSILTFTYFQRSDSQIGKISAVEASVVYRSIPFDPYKSSILFFMTEVLNKVIKEKGSGDQELFTFLRSILEILDLCEKTANFSIKFLYQLTKYLGFYPQQEEGGTFFDLQEGKFRRRLPNHPFYLDERKSSYLMQIGSMQFDGIEDINIPLPLRRELIRDLLQYYSVIIDNFDDIRSLPVLEATWHD